MAMAFTSLGLAGLLVANILPALFSSAGAGGAAPEAAGALPASSAGAVATAAPAPFPIGAAGGPQATDSRTSTEFGALGQPTAALDQSGGSKSNQATSAPGYAAGGAQESAADGSTSRRLASGERELFSPETNWMMVGSLVLLAIGLALFGLRFLARRVR